MSDSLWAEIQSAIDLGYASAADVLGAPHSIYRYQGTGAPLDPANLIGMAPFVPFAKPNSAKTPNLYGNPVWFPQVDPSLVQPFDYIVGPSGTFYMLPPQSLQPPACVSCNASVTLSRPRAHRTPSGFGPQTPGGDDRGSETVLATTWPCSLLEGTKGERPDSNLPGDTRSAWFRLLLPPIPGVRILGSDVLTDGDSRRMMVSSAELTDLGWRLSVALEMS